MTPRPPPQAGLVSPESPEQLLIALEPEAASIYCRKLRLHQLVELSCRAPPNGLGPHRDIDSSFRQGERGRGAAGGGLGDVPQMPPCLGTALSGDPQFIQAPPALSKGGCC